MARASKITDEEFAEIVTKIAQAENERLTNVSAIFEEARAALQTAVEKLSVVRATFPPNSGASSVGFQRVDSWLGQMLSFEQQAKSMQDQNDAMLAAYAAPAAS